MTFERMALGLVLIGLAILALLMPAQSDTFWHLRAGADIWRTGHVPTVDSYSYTVAGLPWPDHEGLSQAYMYLCYRLGGMPGVEIGAALVIGVAVGLTTRLMVGPPSTRLILMAPILALAALLWVLRPQVVSMSLLVVLIWLLARERYRYVPVLFVVWANAHGAVVLGGVVLVAAAACALLGFLRRPEAVEGRRLKSFGLVLPLATLATAATPLGFGIYRFVLESTARLHAEQILEWGPPWPTGPFEVTFWLLALGFVGLLIWRRRVWLGTSWADTVVVVSALAILPLAFRSMRNIGPFLMVLAPAVSRLLGPEFRFRLRAGTSGRTSPDHPRVNLGLFAGIAVVAAGIVVLTWKRDAERLHWHPISKDAQEALRTCPGPVYNHFYEGGFLIWFVPEKPVFIDNRQDPYPTSLLAEDVALEAGAPYRPTFARYGIGCAFLPASSKMVPRLRADGWRVRFVDESWAVLGAAGAS